MVYIRDDRIKAAFVLMMNKLYSNHSIILKPLVEAMKEQDASGSYAKMREIDAKIEENAERAQILVSFLTKGYLDPVPFNKQNNEIKAETARLREQRAALAASSAGGRSALSEAEALLKYLSKESGIIEEFDELLFERFVERHHHFFAGRDWISNEMRPCLKWKKDSETVMAHIPLRI